MDKAIRMKQINEIIKSWDQICIAINHMILCE